MEKCLEELLKLILGEFLEKFFEEISPEIIGRVFGEFLEESNGKTFEATLAKIT